MSGSLEVIPKRLPKPTAYYKSAVFIRLTEAKAARLPSRQLFEVYFSKFSVEWNPMAYAWRDELLSNASAVQSARINAVFDARRDALRQRVQNYYREHTVAQANALERQVKPSIMDAYARAMNADASRRHERYGVNPSGDGIERVDALPSGWNRTRDSSGRLYYWPSSDRTKTTYAHPR